METEPVGESFLEPLEMVCERDTEAVPRREDEVVFRERVLEVVRYLLVIELPVLEAEREDGYFPAFLLAIEYFFELS